MKLMWDDLRSKQQGCRGLLGRAHWRKGMNPNASTCYPNSWLDTQTKPGHSSFVQERKEIMRMAQVIFQVLPGECNDLSGGALQDLERSKAPGDPLFVSSWSSNN